MEKQAFEMIIEILVRMKRKLDEVSELTERIENRLDETAYKRYIGGGF